LDHLGLLAADVATTVSVFCALTDQAPLPAVASARIGVALGSVEPDVSVALLAAVERLRSAGCVVVDVPALPDVERIFTDILLFEAWQVHGSRVTADPDHYGPETLRLLRSGAAVTSAAYDAALVARDRELPGLLEAYVGLDALLTPAGPFVAPVTTPPVDTPEGEAEGRFTAVHNLTGAPAVVLPCGWSSGLPVGLQLSAAPGSDLALLATAGYVESSLAFPTRPAVIR
jgi:Asp-tRNA(Asn)/Glu-tRNA(Gln) amidotransferase A subunit family amidase